MSLRNETTEESRSSTPSPPQMLPGIIQPIITRPQRSHDFSSVEQKVDDPIDKELHSFSPSPTPLLTQVEMNIVQEVPLEASSWYGDEALIDGILETFSSNSYHPHPNTFQLSVGRETSHEADIRKIDESRRMRDVNYVSSTGSSINILSNLTQEDSDDSKASNLQFRESQKWLWTTRYHELIAFKNTYGNCLVPNNWPINNSLSLWVKRQRHQYKLKREGKRSTMTDDRQLALERIDFVWDPHTAVWDERLNELRDFQTRQGHCSVPVNSPKTRQLAIWVKCQRRQYRLFCDGRHSTMTNERIRKLNELGFVWNPQEYKAETDAKPPAL